MNIKIDYNEIDRDVREVVRWINEKTKFATFSSCSSHPDKKEFLGYITFIHTDRTLMFLDRVLDKLVKIFPTLATTNDGLEILYYVMSIEIGYNGYNEKLIHFKIDFTNIFNYADVIEPHPAYDLDHIVPYFWKEVHRIMKETYEEIKDIPIH